MSYRCLRGVLLFLVCSVRAHKHCRSKSSHVVIFPVNLSTLPLQYNCVCCVQNSCCCNCIIICTVCLSILVHLGPSVLLCYCRKLQKCTSKMVCFFVNDQWQYSGFCKYTIVSICVCLFQRGLHHVVHELQFRTLCSPVPFMFNECPGALL